MAKGSFLVELADEDRLVFNPIESRLPAPEDQTQLIDLIGEIETALRILLQSKQEKRLVYLRRLESNAFGGLVGDNPATSLAIRAVEGIKRELVLREGRQIKTKYLVELGWLGLISAVFAVLLFSTGDYWPVWSAELVALKPYFVVWAGSMVGVWISYAVGRSEVSFEELSNMDRRTTEAAIRIVFVGLVATALALFLSTKFMEFSVGGYSFNGFKSSIEIAGILGVIAGFSEKTLPTKLIEAGRGAT